jgi:hypothetical protein
MKGSMKNDNIPTKDLTPYSLPPADFLTPREVKGRYEVE